MITDFHVHTFPEKIAARALSKLSHAANIKYYRDALISTLKGDMARDGIDRAVLLPVATRPGQYRGINRQAIEFTEADDPAIVCFGSLHPEDTNYREIIRELAKNGVKGIKLHPVYQGSPFNDIHFLRIVDCASEYDLIITAHAGLDIGVPGDFAAPQQSLSVIQQVQPEKLVLAHMGGWREWDDVERFLCGQRVYFDTSFTLTPLHHLDGSTEPQMSYEKFLKIVKMHGPNYILMGSDSPWSSMSESLKALMNCGLSASSLKKIVDKNADSLLS